MATSRLPKIARPQTDGLVPRERLFSALDEAGKRAITWVAGPAGAGKTSLIASYLDRRNLSTLWYQVDIGSVGCDWALLPPSGDSFSCQHAQ